MAQRSALIGRHRSRSHFEEGTTPEGHCHGTVSIPTHRIQHPRSWRCREEDTVCASEGARAVCTDISACGDDPFDAPSSWQLREHLPSRLLAFSFVYCARERGSQPNTNVANVDVSPYCMATAASNSWSGLTPRQQTALVLMQEPFQNCSSVECVLCPFEQLTPQTMIYRDYIVNTECPHDHKVPVFPQRANGNERTAENDY